MTRTSASDEGAHTTSACWVRVAHLDDLARAADVYSTLLDQEERQRMGRLATDFLRRRFALSHGLLRETLGRFLDQSPEVIRIRRGENGRPELKANDDARADGSNTVDFNLSYSGSLVACAVISGRRLGVDIERLSARIHPPALEKRVMSAAERDWLAAMEATERHRAFFSIWVLKEAWAKARGEGLGLPFDEVTLRPDADEVVADLSAVGDDGACWRFHRCRVNGEAELALAVEHRAGPAPVIHWQGEGAVELRDAFTGERLDETVRQRVEKLKTFSEGHTE